MQFTRTVQNYQKAYRKKVEGLKAELKSTRSSNTQLQRQVKDLKGFKRVHLPSLAVGVLAGGLLRYVWTRLRQRHAAKGLVEEEAEQGADGAAAPAEAQQ